MDLLTSLEHNRDGRVAPSMVGASIDASKCFDRIRWHDAWTLLQSWGVSSGVICALNAFYIEHSRHTVIKSRLDPVPWTVSAGLLQGCPLSILCAVATVAQWHAAIPQQVTAQSYVDDRVLLTSEVGHLHNAWKASQDWNEENGWKVNTSKSHCFYSGQIPGVLPLDVKKSFTYLGHDVKTHPNQPSHTIQKRATKACHTAERISRLPSSVTSATRRDLIVTVVGPQWAYGLMSSLPSKLLVSRVDRHIRLALWYRRKAFHSWPLAMALVYPPHRVSAWGIMVHCHVRGCCRAFSKGVSQVQTDLWNGAPPARINGPIHVLILMLRQLGMVILPDFSVSLQGTVYDLRAQGSEVLKKIPSLLSIWYLRNASRTRLHLRECLLLTYKLPTVYSVTRILLSSLS